MTIFAFCWSLLFPQTTYIYMYFALTGAIFLGGAGSVIIGGLYWKRGTRGRRVDGDAREAASPPSGAFC